MNDNIVAELQANGLDVEVISKRSPTIQGWIATSAIESISNIASVNRLTLPGYAVNNTGTVDSEGDVIHQADAVRDRVAMLEVSFSLVL